MKASANAFKGYNFQGTIYCYLLCMMDLERKITILNAEMPIDNNFDDIFIKTKNDSFHLQVKNYNNITFDKISIKKDSIVIEDYPPIYTKSKDEGIKNILLVKDLIIPKEKINSEIFGIECNKKNNCYIAGYSEDDYNNKILQLYKNEKRYNEIMHIADKKINSGKFEFMIKDLPPLEIYNQKLQDETIFIRNFSIDKTSNVLFVVGRPGVGKSHLVNEIEKGNDNNNFIIERFWISENDSERENRLKYKNFIKDISYQLFKKAYIESEKQILDELETENKILIVDGLDHVENYNNSEIELYFDFFKKITKSKLIVLTRPLKHKIEYQTIKLQNWNERQSLSYLENLKILDYKVELQIYNISKGYPIIASFLGKHYLTNGKLPEINEAKDIKDFYDKLILNSSSILSIFLINKSYFKMNELEELLSKREYKIVKDLIKNNNYLFCIENDRIYLIHDSLNLYLREKNPDYLEDNALSIEKIVKSLNNGKIGYLPRINDLSLSNDDKVKITKKYCNFNGIREALSKTIDYEMIQDTLKGFEEIIRVNKECFNLNEMYEFILLKQCMDRDNNNGFYELMIARIEYYKKNNIITFEKIFSSGLLYNSYMSYEENNYSPIYNLYSKEFSDSKSETEDFIDAREKNNNYFFFLTEKIDIENYIRTKILGTDLNDRKTLTKLICYLYINKLEYNNFEKVAIAAIDEHDDEKAKKLFEEISSKYNIKPFMSAVSVEDIKRYLFSLGIDNGENYYKKYSLKELIEKEAINGSFVVYEHICNYIRLATFENRKIDIESLSDYYFMYYNRKDYSLLYLPDTLITFYRKKYIGMNECINTLSNAMDMSEKGIRTIMTDFYNLLNKDEFNLAKEYWNDKIILINLDAEKLNLLDESIVIDNFINNYLRYHLVSEYKKLNYTDLKNLLNSKYSVEILYILYEFGFEIDYNHDSEKYSKIKSFKEREYISSEDTEEIKKDRISCTELATYVDANSNTLPYIKLFDIYSKKAIQKNIHEIIHNACFKYKVYDYYAYRYSMLSNFLLMMDRYCITEVDWGELYNTFVNFMKFSLVSFNAE